MAKPKAPVWLREAFRDGVDERYGAYAQRAGYNACWPAKFDPRRRPCKGPLERFHFIGRQRIENAMWDKLIGALVDEPCELCRGSGANPNNVLAPCPGCEGDRVWRAPMLNADSWELILLAAWDPRNGGISCEGHHRRLDNHLGPGLVIDAVNLPMHVPEFAIDYELEAPLAERYPLQ